jgi:hypothetical protein
VLPQLIKTLAGNAYFWSKLQLIGVIAEATCSKLLDHIQVLAQFVWIFPLFKSHLAVQIYSSRISSLNFSVPLEDETPLM